MAILAAARCAAFVIGIVRDPPQMKNAAAAAFFKAAHTPTQAMALIACAKRLLCREALFL